jgi:VanZ family protein
MPKSQKRLPYSTICQFALVGYLAVLFIGTHLPPDSPFLPREIAYLDKVYHFAAYAVLAGLVATSWQLAAGVLTPRHLRLTWVAIAVIGALDEITQIPVGRDCEFGDWVADAVGAATGLLLFAWIRRRIAAQQTDSNQ